MNLFKKILNINGFPIQKAIQHLHQLQQLNNNDLEKYRENAQWEVFNHHLAKNAVYKSWVKENIKSEIVHWDQIPILSKKDLQLPFEQRITTGFKKKVCSAFALQSWFAAWRCNGD